MAATQRTTVQDCAALLDRAEAAGTAYLAALAQAVTLPDPDARRAAMEQAQPCRDAWRAAAIALLGAAHRLDARTP